jgi:hypothetical protein
LTNKIVFDLNLEDQLKGHVICLECSKPPLQIPFDSGVITYLLWLKAQLQWQTAEGIEDNPGLFHVKVRNTVFICTRYNQEE